ncbi:MAG: hypothetical protein NWE88_02060 [Candidatus Bathyarchaeota archaeon]|nr:hypothetical protein [Candidatus Bathyarchaeota archaeon]
MQPLTPAKPEQTPAPPHATHKTLGWITACQDCWRNPPNTNLTVAGSTRTDKCSTCTR